MKLYKDNNNNIYAYEADGSQDHLINNKISITQTEANVIQKEKEAQKFALLNYQQKRVTEYPPMADYLDGIVKGDDTQVQKYIDDCLAVKAKYPKGDE